MEPYKADLKQIYKGVKETYPVCKNQFGQKDEKKKIVSYGACSLCLLEKQLGHPYCPQHWDCQHPKCGKQFLSKKNLDRHQQRYNHLPIKEKGEIK